jgi:hypothetical protein
MKVWKRIFSFLTIMAYGTTSMVPHAWANTVQQDLRSVGEIYQITASTYARTQDKSSITKIMAQGYDKKDLDFVMSNLPESSALPTVSVKNSEFVISQDGFKDVKVRVLDASTGKIQVNGLNFQWNHKQSFKKNADRLLPIVQAEGFSWHKAFLDLLIPSAHAEEEKKKGLSEKSINTIVMAVAAVLVVGLIAVLLYKNAQGKRDSEDKQFAIQNEFNLEQLRTNAELEHKKLDLQHSSEGGSGGGGSEDAH